MEGRCPRFTRQGEGHPLLHEDRRETASQSTVTTGSESYGRGSSCIKYIGPVDTRKALHERDRERLPGRPDQCSVQLRIASPRYLARQSGGQGGLATML